MSISLLYAPLVVVLQSHIPLSKQIIFSHDRHSQAYEPTAIQNSVRESAS
jgi:hypothetical protein